MRDWIARSRRWKTGLLDRIVNRPAPVLSSSPGMLRPSGEEIDEAFLSRLRRVSLGSRPRLASGLTGEHSSPRRGSAIELTDYRSYAPGDDLRRVDWNAYARLGQLFVRQSEAPERVDLHVLLDASESMNGGEPDKFSYARRAGIGLSYVALSHMDTASLVALRGGSFVQVSRQESAAVIARLVRAVASITPSGPTDLGESLGAYAAAGNRSGVVILISDLLSPSGYKEGLRRLEGASLRLVVLHVLSPDELEPTIEGDLELEDAETGATVQVSADQDTLSRYRKWLQAWLEELEQFCSGRGITYVRVDTSYPVEQLLLGRLRREKVLI